MNDLNNLNFIYNDNNNNNNIIFDTSSNITCYNILENYINYSNSTNDVQKPDYYDNIMSPGKCVNELKKINSINITSGNNYCILQTFTPLLI